MSSQRGLKVRGAERQLIELSVEFVIADEYRGQVRFSGSASTGQFSVSGITFDLSVGGLGFRALQFLPRHCEGTIRVMAEAPANHASDAAPAESVPGQTYVRIEHRAKVRRVWMNNNDESYSIGLAFVDATPALEAKVAALLTDVEKGIAGRTHSTSGAVADA